MTLLDAARMALQALEYPTPSWIHGESNPVIDDLRQAIEQAERVAWQLPAIKEWLDKTEWVQATSQPGELGMHRADVLKQRIDRLNAENNALRTAIEQAEQQEPVAWIEHIAGGVEYNPYHKAALKLPEGMRFDLYTAPPQQKPLMDEADVLMLASAHGIDAATVGLYSFYVDCMSTTPPQRKPEQAEQCPHGADSACKECYEAEQQEPLTRPQINQMMADAGWQNSAIRQADLDKVEKVARAIERAHGIGGEK